jgi:ParB-like chromosome segregation protein Spo0J
VRLSDIHQADRTFQVRSPAPIEKLLSSLEREGQHEPIDLVGAKPPHRIVDGFCRVAAARKLGWDSIDALVHRDIGEQEALRIAFTKNVAGEDLSLAEKIHAIALASRQGLSRVEIAELFGLTEQDVDRYMEYLKFPDP